MKDQIRAGMSGKGFYAALSLSVAMVGAACWYAYAGKQAPPSVQETTRPPAVTQRAEVQQTVLSAQTTTTAKTTAATVTHTTAQTTEAAEEAAALLHHPRTETTAATTATTVTAETTAKVLSPLFPVEGDVIAPFSNGELVKSPTTGIWQTHNGTDFAAVPGTEVVAVLDGTVTAVWQDALWGICVSLQLADNTEVRYCGLNEGLQVEAGDEIGRGAVIGAVGETNEAECSMLPHLHLEMRQNDNYIDPAVFLTGGLSGGTAQTETTVSGE